jgi:glycosyltransferase involved in cell wall biosynthesis
MKILHVSACWRPSICGFAPLIENTSKYLKSKGHKILLLTTVQQSIQSEDFDIYTVPIFFNFFRMNPIVFRLKSKLKALENDYDIILLHSYIYEMNFRILLFRKLNIVKKPVILYFHGGLDTRMNPYIHWTIRFGKTIYDATLGKFIFRNADMIISVSKEDIPLISSRFKIPYAAIEYIPNPVNVDNFQTPHSQKSVIFIGRLVYWKGVHFFKKILETIPEDVEFRIVGDGVLSEVVRKLSKEYPNLKWSGNIPHNQVINQLAVSDIFVLPSLTEAAPYSCLEASAAGIPTIAFSVGDIPNILPDSCGFRIQPYDIDDFCEKLRYLLDNEMIRKEMGKNARNHVRQNYSYEIVSEKLLTIIQKTVLNSR